MHKRPTFYTGLEMNGMEDIQTNLILKAVQDLLNIVLHTCKSDACLIIVMLEAASFQYWKEPR